MLQKIIDIIYRNPKSKYLYYKKFGGYFNVLNIEKQRKEMEKASIHLTPVKNYDNGLPIYFLTGKKYLYQTLFCIQSLSQVSNIKFKFYIIDDGTFENNDFLIINKKLPDCVLYDQLCIEKRLEQVIPIEKFPFLHYKRKKYPHIKKITDVHIFEENEWKLVLDSDMLFWQEPTAIIDWLRNPSNPLYMLDCKESYGYSKTIMEHLINKKIKPLINVGAIGLCSKTINWSILEHWCIQLEKKEGITYYLEQALSAMIIGTQKTTVLNKLNYVVNPHEISTSHILHHYVDNSKELYFKQAWKRISQKR